MVIVIVHEVESDELDSAKLVALIVGGFSFLAGSADPEDETMPKIKRMARTEA